MAQLDRFLNILVSNNATALIMSEGKVATVTIKDSARPVMKQALTSAQILTLVREIAPSDTRMRSMRREAFASNTRRQMGPSMWR